MAEPRLHAVLAEFGEPDALLHAVRSLRAQGFERLDAFTPFPVDGLAEALGFRDNKVPVATLIGGIIGAGTGFAMQVATNLDYPLWVGGRPLVTVPAFLLITFEMLVLGAVLAGIVTLFVANRLPRLHHPMFDADHFHFASEDRFFVGVEAGRDFDRDAVGKALAILKPRAIIDVPERPVR